MSHAPATSLEESAAARQQREGYPWLRFAPQLEQEYRHETLRELLPRVRLNLLFGVLLMAAFTLMNAVLPAARDNTAYYWMTLAVIAPLLLAVVALTYLPRAEWLYPRAAEVVMPLAAIGLVTIELMGSHGDGKLAASMLVLAILFAYSLLGLRLYAAMRVCLLSTLAYVVMALRVDLPEVQLAYNTLALAFANVTGAAIGHHLERLQRAHFLESRLLEEAAARDGLTGLFNRRRLDEHLQQCWLQAQRAGTRMALLLVDIDSFKAYNDRYGHQAGDAVLRAVALALTRSARRPTDFVARYGGEEFALVLMDPARQDLSAVAESIHAAVAELRITHEVSATGRQLTVSIGVALVSPASDRTAAGGLQLADEALYAAKEEGRDRTVYREAEYAMLATGVFRRYRRDDNG